MVQLFPATGGALRVPQADWRYPVAEYTLFIQSIAMLFVALAVLLLISKRK